jgi:hypothetical protein
MGYTTKFKGALSLSRPLSITEAKLLLQFNEDPEEIDGDHPGSYFQWVPTESLDGIVWDGNEKFYNYTEWMQWLVLWLGARGVNASGELYWSGEEVGDTGVLTVSGASVTASEGRKRGIASAAPLTLSKLGEMALDQLAAKE